MARLQRIVVWAGLVLAVACGGAASGSPVPSGLPRAGTAGAAISGVALAGAAGAPRAGELARAGGPSTGAGAGAAGSRVAGSAGAGAGSASGGAGVSPSAGSGGASAVAGGSAGAGMSGVGGHAAMGGAGGGVAAPAVPSMGCMKMAPRPQDGVVMQSDRIYGFPAAYDGRTPMPLLLGLHAAGNPVTQLQNLTKGTRLETNFVRVFPKSAGNGWVYDTDVAKVRNVLDDVLANYCIDQSRMFATGHSSGAQMVVQLLCKGETRFKAVAPVAASKYCAKISPIAVMYIQGMMDAQRGGGNGMDVVSVFTSSNACSASTKPWSDVPSCTSAFDHMQVTPGCVAYDNCTAPTLWCSHDDNGYNSTDGRQHGWPCFASDAIADFFMSLR